MTPLVLNELETLLEEMKGALNLLVEHLQAEREAIVEFDLKKIQAAHKAKYEVVIQIQSLEASRKNLIEKLREEMGLKGSFRLEFLLERLSHSAQVEKIRDQSSCIRSIAAAAQEFNENQRDYLACSLQHIQASLVLLDRLQGTATFQGYGPEGGLAYTSASQSRIMNRAV